MKEILGIDDVKDLSKELFGMTVDPDRVIVNEIDVARAVKATVFLSKKKQLFCYIHGKSNLTLADVRKIIARMGLKIDICIPPKGQPQYFNDIATQHFRKVFPGRKPLSDDDLAYYRTLAPYNPALVLISEIRDGHIYQFDADSHSSWRVAAKFAYRRIKTS